MSTVIEPLTITDAGPIENLTIPVPPEGGIVVLSGRNGSGKTTALNSAESLMGAKPTISARDGSSKAVITGFGATLRVGRRASRTGELEVSSLEGNLSPASLVDPGLKSADAADAVRIKALLQLVNARPDMASFYSLLDNQETFEKYVPEDFSDETDVVALAGRIKRSLEQTARREEAISNNEAGKAAAYSKAVEHIDISDVPDSAELQAQLEASVSYQTRLNEQAVQSERLSKQAAEAREKLDEFQPVDRSQLTNQLRKAWKEQETAKQSCDDAWQQVEQAEVAFEKAKMLLRDAKDDHSELSSQLENANNMVAALVEHDAKQQELAASADEAIANWKQSIEAAEQCECPTIVDLERASIAVANVREAIEQAAITRNAIEQAAKADEHKQASVEHQKVAATLRESAKATDDILSDLVSRCGTDLHVRSGRLMVKTKRGLTLFCELSHGERWKIAIDIALKAFPANSDQLPVLTVEQEAWEGLDPTNRSIIAEHARERRVLILTAECSDDETVTAAEFN